MFGALSNNSGSLFRLFGAFCVDSVIFRTKILPGDRFFGPKQDSDIFKGLRPPAADPQQNEGMMLRGYENHEAIALVTCAS